MSFEDVTIIIPTQNRYYLLKRAVDYYSKFECNFIICDSSDVNYISSFNSNSILYLHYESNSFAKKICNAIQYVKTKYVCLSADDDFLSMKGLIQGVIFLENNKDYYSVQGKYLQFHSYNKKYTTVSLYDAAGLIHYNSDSPFKRASDSSKNGMHLIYALHRTESLTNSFNLSEDCTPIPLVEYTSNLVPVFYGKHKMLDIFWMARDSKRYKTILESTLNKSLNKIINAIDLINYFNTLNGIDYKNKFILKYMEVTNSNLVESEKLFYEVFFQNYIQNDITKLLIKKDTSLYIKLKTYIKLNKFLYKNLYFLYDLLNRIFNNNKYIFPFIENEDEWDFIKSILIKHGTQLDKFKI